MFENNNNKNKQCDCVGGVMTTPRVERSPWPPSGGTCHPYTLPQSPLHSPNQPLGLCKGTLGVLGKMAKIPNGQTSPECIATETPQPIVRPANHKMARPANRRPCLIPHRQSCSNSARSVHQSMASTRGTPWVQDLWWRLTLGQPNADHSCCNRPVFAWT